jgi:L-asparaginase
MGRTVLANDLAEVGIQAAVGALRSGLPALDVVEHGIRPVEADASIRFVGRGGDPNLLGEVECDAAIMDGSNLNAGSVGALKGFLHAISVARSVMERLPHVMLAGEGAARFAAETGAERAELLTDGARDRFRAWLEKNVPPDVLAGWPDVPLSEYAWTSATPKDARGTVVCLAMDGAGDIAAGTSTSGWAYKYPGRIGDSPVIGAGIYAHNPHGACVCTHTGEMTIRANTAASVVGYMKRGAAVRDACFEALDDLRELRDGYLGPVAIHAMDRDGRPFVLSTQSTRAVSTYLVWAEGMDGVENRRPEIGPP